MILVSLIIPIYNTEKYIGKLLSKLECQLSEQSELILIDDGSKDNSFSICDLYQKKNPNIHAYHQENQGASAARNLGLLKAQGEYIAFIDSDDDISENYIQCVTELLKAHKGVDLVQLGAYYCEKGKNIFVHKIGQAEGYLDIKEYSDFILSQNSNPPWDKLYRAEIIKNNNVKFKTNMIMGEDVSFTLDFLKHTQVIFISKKAVYYDEKNEEGLCSNVTLNYFDDLNKLYKNMFDFIAEKQLADDAVLLMKQSMLRSFFRAVGLCKIKKISSKAIKAEMKKGQALDGLYREKFPSLQDKIRALLLRRKQYFLIGFLVKMKK